MLIQNSNFRLRNNIKRPQPVTSNCNTPNQMRTSATICTKKKKAIKKLQKISQNLHLVNFYKYFLHTLIHALHLRHTSHSFLRPNDTYRRVKNRTNLCIHHLSSHEKKTITKIKQSLTQKKKK